jgi:hypothetical protein
MLRPVPLVRHLTSLFALVVGIQNGDRGLDLCAQKVEAIVIDRLRCGALICK